MDEEVNQTQEYPNDTVDLVEGDVSSEDDDDSYEYDSLMLATFSKMAQEYIQDNADSIIQMTTRRYLRACEKKKKQEEEKDKPTKKRKYHP